MLHLNINASGDKFESYLNFRGYMREMVVLRNFSQNINPGYVNCKDYTSVLNVNTSSQIGAWIYACPAFPLYS